MYFYQFNIGDYASHTRHLTRDEDLAYRRLLDLYYLQEKPLPKDPAQCARLIAMSDCSTDVERILNEFFTPDENGWINKRADQEIAKYHGKSVQASNAGKASAKARLERSLNGISTDVERNKKQETRNNKQETNKNISRQAALVCPADVSDQVWKDFLATRKAKLTETALKGIIREAQKAGWTLESALQECSVRGWRGFKADWVLNRGKSGYMINKQEAIEARNRAVGDEWLKKMENEENASI